MKKLTAILLAICLTLTLLPSFAFAKTDEEEAQVRSLLGMLNVMVGDADGEFYPDNLVTRGEFTKIAVMSSKKHNAVPKSITSSPFGDVPYSLWSAPYIKIAIESNLIKGYPDSTFRPENPVALEEAVSICVNLLGYTTDDYGLDWPQGPLSLADSLNLLDNVDKTTGEFLTRRDVMYLIYNTLDTKINNTQTKLVNNLDFTYKEDLILIATKEQNASISANRILTNQGTFKIDSTFSVDLVGRKGTAFIKDNDTIVSFIPDDQSIKNFSVYTVLNKDILVYNNGTNVILNVDEALTCYDGSQTKNIGACIPTLQTGDIIKIAYDQKGDADYAIISPDALKGPFVVYSDNWKSVYGVSTDATILRNGKEISANEIALSDVIYYAPEMNLVFAYAKKVTGTYTKAIPNQDNPTSVEIAGKTYAIESVEAFNKLRSGGTCKFGDTITVLLGRTDQIADVATGNFESNFQYGLLIDTGLSEFTSTSGNPENSYYATVVMADGTPYKYKVNRDYKEDKNHIVLATTKDGVTTLSSVLSNSGKARGYLNCTKMLLGEEVLADDVHILDVCNPNESYSAALYATVFPKRLDGCLLETGNILFAERNSSGEIISLFLKDVTGDAYSYGIVTEADTGVGMASYTVNIGSKTVTYAGSKIAQLGRGDAVSVDMINGMVTSLGVLRSISQKITKVENNTAYSASGTKYPLGDNVVVIKRINSSSAFTSVALDDVDFSKGSFTYFYNGSWELGGRIRVIYWETPLE